MLGVIDLDPCSNVGGPNVPARRHFAAESDGLSRRWSGTIFMNPTYGSTIAAWVSKLEPRQLTADRAQHVRDLMHHNDVIRRTDGGPLSHPLTERPLDDRLR